MDRRTRSTDIEFSVNLGDIYKFNSRYYDIYNNLSESEKIQILQRMRIASIEVCRRRMTKFEIRNNHLGAQKRIPFDQLEESYHSVGKSSQISLDLPVQQFVSEHGVLREMENPEGVPNTINILSSPDREEYYKTFYANDLQIREMWDSGGVYQYGVKIKVIDDTREYFKQTLQLAREHINLLTRYLAESQVPVFDQKMVHKIDEQNATSANIFDPPRYASDINQVGNYDTRTETFTDSFVEKSLQTYFRNGRITEIVKNYQRIVRISFGKSFVSLSRSSVNLTQRDDTSADPQPNRVEEILRRENVVDMETSVDAMINMIHPRNSRPEQIQSFLKSYQDVVSEVEKYFNLTYDSNIFEGSGYTAKEPLNVMEVERWFSSSDTNVDEDNFIYLNRVFDINIFTSIFLSAANLTSPRSATQQDLMVRFAREANRFGILSSDVASLSPDAVVIGDDLILLHPDLDELEAVREETRLSRGIPNYRSKRIITLGSGRITPRNQDPSGKSIETPSDDQVQANMSNMNGFISLMSGLSNAEVANAISMANQYEGEGYFTYLSAVSELLQDNYMQSETEIPEYSRRERQDGDPIQTECDGVTLEQAGQTEVVSFETDPFLSDAWKSMIPYVANRVRPFEENRLRDIVDGPLPEVASIIAQNNLMNDIAIPHLNPTNINNSTLMVSSVSTLENKTPNSFTGIGKKNTVGSFQQLMGKAKSLSLSGFRTNKALSGTGAFSISKEFTKLKIAPKQLSTSQPGSSAAIQSLNPAGFASSPSVGQLQTPSVTFGASQSTVQQFQTPNRAAGVAQTIQSGLSTTAAQSVAVGVATGTSGLGGNIGY